MQLITKLKNSALYNSAVIPYHVATTALIAAKAKFPARRLTVIGVTGTNGKTTTCFMIWKMLNSAGHKTGLMTTVAWGVDKLESQVEHMTTVDAKTLNSRIARIAEQGAEFLVLEVTSHALAQHRILGVPVDTAIFTNLTHEHLDYHKTLENYRAAKVKLFKKARFGIINADDRNCEFFAREVPECQSYGLRNGDLRAEDIDLHPDGVRFKADGQVYHLHLTGEFNVSNALAAILVGRRYDLSDRQIAKGLASLDAVEGRMNLVNAGQKFKVIVDFAHTPDAFQKVFDAVAPAYGGTRQNRQSAKNRTNAVNFTAFTGEETEINSEKTRATAAFRRRRNPRANFTAFTREKSPTNSENSAQKGKKPTPGKIISLFGGAGRRDETTRAERGEIAGKYSDIVVITEDDSRDEDPLQIAEMFKAGVLKAGVPEKDIYIELDRAKAIALALSLARPADTVLILGKGHEKTILRADGPHPFEDLKVTEKTLQKLIKERTSHRKVEK